MLVACIRDSMTGIHVDARTRPRGVSNPSLGDLWIRICSDTMRTIGIEYFMLRRELRSDIWDSKNWPGPILAISDKRARVSLCAVAKLRQTLWQDTFFLLSVFLSLIYLVLGEKEKTKSRKRKQNPLRFLIIRDTRLAQRVAIGHPIRHRTTFAHFIKFDITIHKSLFFGAY